MKNVSRLVFLASAMQLLGACALAAGAAAGGIAADEISEGDGKFDPLEESYDDDDETTPIIYED
ncbi:MAG: hypothetical protein GC152_00990 [Alphaproteobacteria bacterium]|nr:hypothetical protein [Alphaproteobacteria bacterium]